MTDELITAKFKVDDRTIWYSIVNDYDDKDALRITFEDKDFNFRVYLIKKSLVSGDFLVLPSVINELSGDVKTTTRFGYSDNGVEIKKTQNEKLIGEPAVAFIDDLLADQYTNAIKSSLTIRAFLKEQGFNIEVEPKSQGVGK